MRVFLSQSFLLLISFAFVFIWEKTLLSEYTIQALGFFVFLFLLISSRKKTFSFGFGAGTSLSVFALNTVILLLIFSTGGINSNLFFLLYFLCFGIAFIFKPKTVFVFVLGIILLFLEYALINDVFNNLLKLSSIALISPLSFFFGREYIKGEKEKEKTEALKERTKDSADTISNDVEMIINDSKSTLKPLEIDKLNEILEETEDLRQESKEKDL